MRFSLFMAPNLRPILAIGNTTSKIFFWDLQALEEWDGTDIDPSLESSMRERSSTRGRGGRKRGGPASRLQQREESVASSAATPDTFSITMGSDDNAKGAMTNAWRKYNIESPFRPLMPHRTLTVKKVTFTARQMAWSVGGEWAVVVGSQGMIALFYREEPM